MAGFSLRRRKFAPSGVALEASHEAAGAGLVAGFMFGPGSNSLIDLCGNQWIEMFRHAHAVNPLTGKPALACTNATGRMRLPNGLRLLSRTAGSVAISSRITGYAGAYPRRLQTQDDSMFRLARLAADNQVTVHLFGSNVDITTTAPYYTTGQSVMGLSWDASHPTIKRGLYREGVLVGSSSTAPGSDTEDRYIQLDGGAGEVDWLFFFDRQVDQQALFDDPMALVRARRQVVYFDLGGGGITGAVNQASTTDTAQSLGKAKLKIVGQASEIDSAQAVALLAEQIVAVNQVDTTDSARAVSPAKFKAIGQAVETGTVQAFTSRKLREVGQVVETNTAQNITPSGPKLIAVGQASETDFAQAVAKAKALGILQPVETDSAHSITRVKARAIGQVVDTSEAQPVTAVGGATPTLSPEDIASIAAAVWAHSTAVDAHAKLDAILARLQC